MQPWQQLSAQFLNTPTGTNGTTPNLENGMDVFKQAQEMTQNFWKEQMAKNMNNDMPDMQKQMESITPILQSFGDLAKTYAQDPAQMMQMQLDLYQSNLALWANMAERAMGNTPNATISPAKDDRRFAGNGWQENMMFDFIKQSYLLLSKWVFDGITNAKDISPTEKEKLAFYSRQFLDALSPSNFMFTNPDVLEEMVKTNGQNLLDGLNNLLADLKNGKISMTDYDAFEIGKNIATTKGDVVFRNTMLELIQYAPTTKQVHARPLLVAPPWINRFYVLDLKENNSFIKYAVSQGFTVFLISWKNPTEAHRDVNFEDYMKDGLLTAVDKTCEITDSKDVNAVGYCIGGSLLSATLAALSKKKDTRIHSATFFTTLMDFTNAGELSVFIDEQQVSALEAKMAKKGFLEGKEMASTFSMLRANDLVWSFVVNNYLLGKQPFPFDILYWNDDSTRMPAAMHSWYLRNLYLENNLIKKNKLTLLGEKIDLTNIEVPIYMVSGINDHITPWESCYSPLPSFKSKEKRFVLSKAGHVAGVVNPPTPKGKPVKRAYWVGNATDADAQTWLQKQTQTADSWWPDYAKWLSGKSGEKIAAPTKAGSAKNKVLCAAPGTYVLEK